VPAGWARCIAPHTSRCAFSPLPGLDYHRSLPEVDAINFVSWVKQPVMMLNGRYDFFFPVESTQQPFSSLLGPRKDDKKHIPL
jgi:hypothetical protein